MIRFWCCNTAFGKPHLADCPMSPREDRPIDYDGPVEVAEPADNPLNLPWTVEYADGEGRGAWGAFPWLVLDRWGVVIGRFDREAQARRAVGVES